MDRHIAETTTHARAVPPRITPLLHSSQPVHGRIGDLSQGEAVQAGYWVAEPVPSAPVLPGWPV